VAGTLELHLQRNRFERWYLQEALGRLVRGASQRLWDLSKEQFSLELSASGTDFVVLDHINMDERRSVRTLSGGETFLASLALALALGDEITSLASSGAARLDALFLDEGFGTLDRDTLETVASAIEELGARGRMVGIVTHVRELAERVPVRYELVKVGRNSQITRLDNR
jgi:exonuclease SbcC